MLKTVASRTVAASSFCFLTGYSVYRYRKSHADKQSLVAESKFTVPPYLVLFSLAADTLTRATRNANQHDCKPHLSGMSRSPWSSTSFVSPFNFICLELTRLKIYACSPCLLFFSATASVPHFVTDETLDKTHRPSLLFRCPATAVSSLFRTPSTASEASQRSRATSRTN